MNGVTELTVASSDSNDRGCRGGHSEEAESASTQDRPHSQPFPLLSSETESDSVSPQVSTKDELNLCSCTSVIFESHDGVPGVNYDTGEGEIPVKASRRGRTHSSRQQSDSESSDQEVLTIPQSQVDFMPINETPGLRIATSRTRMWTPIAARTRFKKPTT